MSPLLMVFWAAAGVGKLLVPSTDLRHECAGVTQRVLDPPAFCCMTFLKVIWERCMCTRAADHDWYARTAANLAMVRCLVTSSNAEVRACCRARAAQAA